MHTLIGNFDCSTLHVIVLSLGQIDCEAFERHYNVISKQDVIDYKELTPQKQSKSLFCTLAGRQSGSIRLRFGNVSTNDMSDYWGYHYFLRPSIV